MQFLLDANDDWIETSRRYLYPRLHDTLVKFGSLIGTPMYSIGTVRWNQYIGTFSENEESIEGELVKAGFRRNPIACLKSLPDGRVSEGSWVLLNEDAPDYVAPGMQLHVTIFERDDGKAGRVFYGHYEDDWRESPFAHLRAKQFNANAGVDIARNYLDEHTFLIRYE